MTTIRIDHPKVAGLEPRWAPFPGCSLIFDRVGLAGGGDALDAVYQRLADGVSQFATQAMRRDTSFCPLPLDSYHVTFLDLINAQNVGLLHDAFRARVCGDGHLDLAATATVLAPLLVLPDGLDDALAEVRFAFDKLLVFGRGALVAGLKNAGSPEPFARLLAARQELGERLAVVAGLHTSAYQPHVSLGYLANRDLAENIQRYVPAMDERLGRTLAGLEVDLGVPRLFAFPDMARFTLATP